MPLTPVTPEVLEKIRKAAETTQRIIDASRISQEQMKAAIDAKYGPVPEQPLVAREWRLTIGKDVVSVARARSEHSHSVSITIFDVTGWEDNGSPAEELLEEVAVIEMKCDGCSHVGFRCPALNNEWVHTCGAPEMEKYLVTIKWGWNLCVDWLREKGFDNSCDGDFRRLD